MTHSGFGSEFGHFGNWLCGSGAVFPGHVGWMVTLLFWALVIYLAVKLFQTLFSDAKGIAATHLNTLKERYARGEISDDEYHRMKSELN